MVLRSTEASGATRRDITVVVDSRDSLAAACALGHDAFYPQVCVGDVKRRDIGPMMKRLYPGKTTTAVARIGVLNVVARISTMFLIDPDEQVRKVLVELSGDRQAPEAWISVDGIPVARSTPEAALRRINRGMPEAWCAKAYELAKHTLHVLACCRPSALALEKRIDGLTSGDIPNERKEERPPSEKPRRAASRFRRGHVIIDMHGNAKRRNACYINCEVDGGPEGQGTLYVLVFKRRARKLRRGFSIGRDRRVSISREQVVAMLERLGCDVPRSPAALAAAGAALLISLNVLARDQCAADRDPEAALSLWLHRHGLISDGSGADGARAA